ncbi:MAG: hypothetical protein LC808_34960 [Actinobacteria bacterium]|nr:hypothetical protein [Actinomycetota bacterium]
MDPIRVQFHRGSPDLDGFDTIKFAEPLLRAGDGQTPLISEVPLNAKSTALHYPNERA